MSEEFTLIVVPSKHMDKIQNVSVEAVPLSHCNVRPADASDDDIASAVRGMITNVQYLELGEDDGTTETT